MNKAILIKANIEEKDIIKYSKETKKISKKRISVVEVFETKKTVIHSYTEYECGKLTRFGVARLRLKTPKDKMMSNNSDIIFYIKILARDRAYNYGEKRTIEILDELYESNLVIKGKQINNGELLIYNNSIYVYDKYSAHIKKVVLTENDNAVFIDSIHVQDIVDTNNLVRIGSSINTIQKEYLISLLTLNKKVKKECD